MCPKRLSISHGHPFNFAKNLLFETAGGGRYNLCTKIPFPKPETEFLLRSAEIFSRRGRSLAGCNDTAEYSNHSSSVYSLSIPKDLAIPPLKKPREFRAAKELADEPLISVGTPRADFPYFIRRPLRGTAADPSPEASAPPRNGCPKSRKSLPHCP